MSVRDPNYLLRANGANLITFERFEVNKEEGKDTDSTRRVLLKEVISARDRPVLQGYLAHKKHPPPRTLQ